MRYSLRFCALCLGLIVPILSAALTITPTGNFFPVTGSGVDTSGNGVVAVSAPGGTPWTAASNVNWLSVVTGTSGTGNGSVTFSVAPNSTGAVRTGTLTIAGQTFTVTQLGPPPAANSVPIVEYHDGVDDDYFITGEPAEQLALNAAAQAGAVWSATGLSFNSGGDAPVYRFIYRSPSGVNTHFYTVNTHEQSSLLANNPIWVLESPVAFYMKAANANQTCPPGYVPVYRAAQEQTGSHRFATQQSAIDQVLARGWTNEGVAFCAPATGGQTAEGFWTGSTSTGRSIETTVLDNGTYYFLYTQVNNPLGIGGLLQGTGTSVNGIFSSSNGKNFSIEAMTVVPATITANYAFKQTFIGTATYPTLSLSTTFSTAYNAAYDQQAQLGAVAGTYSGQIAVAGTVGGVDLATLTITSSGGVSGMSAGGCALAGTYRPRAHANVFDMTITLSGSNCPPATNGTFIGIGYYSLGSLKALATDTGRTNAFMFVGIPNGAPLGPQAPTGVTATAGASQVTIAWNPVPGAASYNVYWSTSPGVTPSNGTKISGASSPQQITGLASGTTVYAVVTAVFSSGESAASSQVSATTTSGGSVVFADYVGNWIGSWHNNTFGSSGPATLTVALDPTGTMMTWTIAVQGNVFGGPAPPPETFIGTVTATGITLSGRSVTFGNLLLNIDTNGGVSGSGTNVNSPNVSRFDFSGTWTKAGFNLTYIATLTAGGTASGSFSMSKQ